MTNGSQKKLNHVARTILSTSAISSLLLLTQSCQTHSTEPATAASETSKSSTPQAIPSDEVASRAAFLAVYPVLMHPRCMNCHPKGDQPLQGEDSHIHLQNVQRGPDGKGLFAMKSFTG